MTNRPCSEVDSGSEPSLSTPTRRAVLRGGAALAAAAGVANTAAAQAVDLQPAPLTPWILGRASFGVTPRMVRQMEALGVEGWIDWQLEPQSIDDAALDAKLSSFEWLGQTAAQMRAHPTKEEWEIAHEGRGVRLLRATFSERQLFERIVEFWTDHFNIYGSDDDLWTLKLVDDVDVIRSLALGKFRDLLHASAKSPAMIAYLNNDSNVAGAPQENYAREVMELHTLGVTGPYTENDVRELARCFTGWNFWKMWESTTQYGIFRFKSWQHDTGSKQLLGLQIPAGGGLSDAETVLDHLASHPSTIDFVTTKLARWLLGYSPPAATIEAAKACWVATDGDIKEIVRTLLSRRSMLEAKPWANPKFKRPFHWAVSFFRATGIDLPRSGDTIWTLFGTGQVPYQWPAPNGYPDAVGAWASLLMPRWQRAAHLGLGWEWSTDHTSADMRALLDGAPKEEWAQRIADLLTSGTMPRREVRRIQAYIDTFANPTDQIVGEAFELVASSPGFGRY